MTDRIALITGGSRGLGRNAALHLAREGVGVVLTWHSRSESADAVVAEIEGLGGKAVALRLDTGEMRGFDADSLTATTDDINVRKAICHAIDVDEMIATVIGKEYASKASGPIPYTMWGHDPNLKTYD